MANPFGGLGNLGNLGNLQNMRNPGNMANLKGIMPGGPGALGNQLNIGNMANMGNLGGINGLDKFLEIADNPDVLKGAISKIQMGGNLGEDDLKGLSSKDAEFARDFSAINRGAGPGQLVDKFSGLMENYLNDVSNKHIEAEKAVETFASGGNIDLHTVMIATEKANLSMQLAMQLRNKLIRAYQEIHNIRV